MNLPENLTDPVLVTYLGNLRSGEKRLFPGITPEQYVYRVSFDNRTFEADPRDGELFKLRKLGGNPLFKVEAKPKPKKTRKPKAKPQPVEEPTDVEQSSDSD